MARPGRFVIPPDHHSLRVIRITRGTARAIEGAEQFRCFSSGDAAWRSAELVTFARRRRSTVSPSSTCWRKCSMKRIAEVTRRFVKDEEGIAVSEYGLLVGIVAVGLVAVVTAFKNQIGTWFTNITSQLTATK